MKKYSTVLIDMQKYGDYELLCEFIVKICPKATLKEECDDKIK